MLSMNKVSKTIWSYNSISVAKISLPGWYKLRRVFPIDTPLVLRLVKTHMGKCLFSPELKSYLITQ